MLYTYVSNYDVAMSSETDALRDLFLDVSEEGVLTERQEEEPSRDPIDERDAALEAEISGMTRQDGLEDAVDGSFSKANIEG